MEAKEKAEQLLQSFGMVGIDEKQTKKCALICIDEMIKEVGKQGNEIAVIRLDFLDKVKDEINLYK